MNIKKAFSDALVTPPKHGADYNPDDFTGVMHIDSHLPSSPLFSLLSAGTTHAVYPFSFDISSLDCFMFLYTKEGCGKLLMGNQVYTLASSSLLFMDCRTHFKLDIAVAPWDFQIFFITGEVFSYYSGFLSSDRLMIHDTPPFSQTALHLEKLLQLAAPNSIQADLLISSYINSILTDCIMGAITQNGQSVHIAPYLSDAKKILDSSFADVHSLDNLAAKLHISKYRLCREFGDTYGMPPLKYLNHRRIEIARHLLQTTNLKVHEIGSRVGIDNTNHFINLFRRENGMTPSEYKQRMTF